MAKDFQINDLVWGKMKGYPPWPGKIVAPPSDLKPKKNCHYVFFFGSENSAWITDDCIEMHTDEILEKYINRKGALLQKAIQTIVEHSNASQFSKSIGVPKPSKEKSSEAEKMDTSDDKPQYESSPGSACSTESRKQDDINMPSTSGAYFNPDEFKKCAENFKLLQLDYEDIATGIVGDMAYPFDGDIPHSDVVIPHPNTLNCVVPSEKVEYVERPQSPPFDYSKSKCLKERNIVPTKKKIGFLGFTKAAQGIIKNFAHSGHSVIICNEKGKECKMFADKLKVKIASTPADVIKATDIIFSCVSDRNTVKDFVYRILLKELERSKGKKGYVEMTNIPPHVSEMIATEIKMKGGLYLEAPLCGSRVDAAEGTLFISAAGDKTLYDDCESCFDAISKKHMYVSPEIGTASKMNLIHNMFIGTTYAALAESMSLLETRGLGDDFLTMLKISDLNSTGLVQKAEAMVHKNFQTETSVDEMQENFTLGLALGHEVSHSTSVFSMANEAYKKTKNLKYGEHDVSAVIEATKQ